MESPASIPRSAWRNFGLLLTLGIISVSLWVFISLTNHVVGGTKHETEAKIMRVLRTPEDLAQPIGPRWLKLTSLDITALGSAPVLLLVTTLVVGYLLLDRKFTPAILIVCSTASGAVMSNLLKQIINRDRPNIVPHLAEVTGQSYPSGHSMLSSVVYLTLAVVLAQIVTSRRGKVYILASAILIIVMVGITRVFIGVHYPTDVLAGWCAGTVWALLVWLAASHLQHRGMVERGPATRSRG
ncbi:MAG: phosphatase PAP2 family protein [Chthoniobacterales bacterium]